MKRFFFLIFILILYSSLSFGESDSTYIAQGDRYHKEFNDEEALEYYLKVLEKDGANYEALWKAARSYINIGDSAEKEDKKSNYVEAEKLARKLVEVYPDSAESHFELAKAIGKIALYEGGKKKIELSKELKKEAEIAVELNPQHDGAYHAIARWHRELANLSWVLKAAAKVVYGGVPKGASNENAVLNFEKAIAINPKRILHHLELGKTYIEMKKWEKARSEFNKVLELPINEFGDRDRKEEAKKLLKEIKNKK